VGNVERKTRSNLGSKRDVVSTDQTEELFANEIDWVGVEKSHPRTVHVISPTQRNVESKSSFPNET
jgi:predicted RNase H-like nuclease (RuvC/YqgF family)